MIVRGRKLVVVKGGKSQTINICTRANLRGKYDYTVRFQPPFMSAETIAYGNLDTIQDFVRFLKLHGGQIELEPPADGPVASSPNNSFLHSDRQITVESKFRAWRDSWDDLGDRVQISDLVDLWRAPVPDPWMRSENDTPARLRTRERYTRGNLNGLRRGECIIEHQILVEYFDSVRCLDQPLLDGVNAFPLVKDEGGGRGNNVEADLILLTGQPESARIMVCDVKVTDGDPFKALLQNLRQLRLFTLNPLCSMFFGLRGSTARAMQICGGVIAPESFYSRLGYGDDRLRRAKSLADAMAKPPISVTTELLLWDAATRRLTRCA